MGTKIRLLRGNRVRKLVFWTGKEGAEALKLQLAVWRAGVFSVVKGGNRGAPPDTHTNLLLVALVADYREDGVQGRDAGFGPGESLRGVR